MLLRSASSSFQLAFRPPTPPLRASHAAAASSATRPAARATAALKRLPPPSPLRSKFAAAAISLLPSTSSSDSDTSSSSSSSSSSFSSSSPSPPPASSSPSYTSSSPPRFRIHPIAGDGSCLFRALAQGAHYLDSSSSSPSSNTSSNFGPPSEETTSSGGGGGTSAFLLGPGVQAEKRAAPPPLLLEGPELLAAGFAVRRKICAALVRNKEEIECFLETPFHAYVDAMSTEGTWGGEPELSVAPEALGRPVCVYSRARDLSNKRNSRSRERDFASLFFGDDIVKVSEYGVDDFEGVAPICLLFGGFHYDLLVVEG